MSLEQGAGQASQEVPITGTVTNKAHTQLSVDHQSPSWSQPQDVTLNTVLKSHEDHVYICIKNSVFTLQYPPKKSALTESWAE
jgi:hypothetical protein